MEEPSLRLPTVLYATDAVNRWSSVYRFLYVYTVLVSIISVYLLGNGCQTEDTRVLVIAVLSILSTIFAKARLDRAMTALRRDISPDGNYAR